MARAIEVDDFAAAIEDIFDEVSLATGEGLVEGVSIGLHPAADRATVTHSAARPKKDCPL